MNINPYRHNDRYNPDTMMHDTVILMMNPMNMLNKAIIVHRSNSPHKLILVCRLKCQSLHFD